MIGTREKSFLSQLSTSGELADRGRNWEESVGTVTRVANERLTGMSDAKTSDAKRKCTEVISNGKSTLNRNN